MELRDISMRIEDLANELEDRKKDLQDFVATKPMYHAIRDLKKRTAVETAKQRAKGTPATVIKDIVGGEVDAEEAQIKQIKMEFDAKRDLIDATKAQLMGFQSIFKYFPET